MRDRSSWFLTRTGRIPIEKLVTSRVMDELMDLAMSQQPEAGSEQDPNQRAKNWFSAENALRVYNTVCPRATTDPACPRTFHQRRATPVFLCGSTWSWTRTTTASSASGSSWATVGACLGIGTEGWGDAEEQGLMWAPACFRWRLYGGALDAGLCGSDLRGEPDLQAGRQHQQRG